MRKIFYIILLSFIIHSYSYAQLGVPVNMQTGAPNVNIPIYEIKNGDVSIPISLYYTPGVKPSLPYGNDEYNIGVGWSLNAGAKITRAVKSLPDDYQGTGSDTRKGWLYDTFAASVINFTPQSRADCSGDVANYNILNSLANNKTDTQPDLFSFSFGSYSGRFMFDNNKAIQMLPYQDLKIQATYATNGAITAFTITANNGFQYTFTPTTTVTESVSPEGNANTVYYLRDKLIKYAQPVSYTTVWSLSTINSPSGGAVLLSYNQQVPVDSVLTNPPSTAIYLAPNGSTQDTILKKKLFYTRAIVNTKTLSSISEQVTNYPGANPGYETINFNYQGSSLTGFQIIVPNTPPKTISLNSINTGGYIFLQSIRPYSSGCTISPPYEFEYWGTTLGSSTSLTSPKGNEQDYWGYFNANKATSLVPRLYMYPNEPPQERYRLQPIPGYSGTYNYLSPGADRTVNPNAITAGSLRRIIYPTGGSVKIDYEANQYFDTRANQTFLGGGVRVKTVTLHDGINTANDIIKNYTYTSGLLLNRPQFAFPVPVYTEPNGTVHTISEYADQPSQARFFTARSDHDLNPYDFDAADVLYQSGTESQTGNGKIVNQYTTPAMYGQTSSSEYSAPNQWQAAYSQYATTTNPSSGACMTKGLMADGYYSFPFPANPNYNFERGLLQNTQVFNETGQLVKRVDYQYSPIYQATAPVSIYGVSYDYFTYNSGDINTKAFAYGKYRLFGAMTKYQTIAIEKTYDPGTNFTAFTTIETDNFYNSPNHRLLSSTQTMASNDGINFTTYKTKYKYIQDYTLTAATDPVTAGILALKNAYINSAVIEKITSITKPGQSEMVTGGQLNKYNIFSIAKPILPMQTASFLTPVLPSQSLSLKTNIPLANFVESAITNNQFQSDSRYQINSNVSEYSTLGRPVSADDGHQQAITTLYDISGVKPIANIKNALASQVLYSNFDDDLPVMTKLHSFDEAYNSSFTSVPGRIGYGLSVAPNYLFSKSSVNKGAGDYYSFSCWVKNPTTVAGTISITLNDGSHTSNGIINYTNVTGVWSYYRVRIPVTNLNATFSISVQTGNLPLIVDDMLFHPELAPATLTGYQNKLKIADTDPHGNTTFYTYDALGRPTTVTDQNQNILKQLTYSYRSAYLLNAAFVYDVKVAGGVEFLYRPATVNASTPVDFLSGPADPCEPAGIVRNWDFGDGTTLSNGGLSPSHTYTSAGVYTVKLTVTSNLYGTVTSTQTITVMQQLAFALHTTGIVAYNLCSQQVLGYGDLGPGSSPLGTNIYTATVNGSYTNQFLWEMAYANAPNTWITLPGTSNTITVMVAGNQYGPARSSQSYTLRCTMVPQGLQKAAVQTSSILYIAPNCPL
ncbi:PKD domain-containing protein [Mucilaginibacter sp. cycad4]|uniref:PKD domain-containing protein n=1 Tax=Mucilaginibacter sp. cycad4 TaxID=3342096 RepID=UPI002AAB40A6|nr:PKD domain-containing protein [Mucilaginibacter gossypii]WPU98891.1 PKD domain-containing protein [Mucilaginibacter gossypii]